MEVRVHFSTVIRNSSGMSCLVYVQVWLVHGDVVHNWFLCEVGLLICIHAYVYYNSNFRS